MPSQEKAVGGQPDAAGWPHLLGGFDQFAQLRMQRRFAAEDGEFIGCQLIAEQTPLLNCLIDRPHVGRWMEVAVVGAEVTGQVASVRDVVFKRLHAAHLHSTG